jgi:hypothetical protein
LCFEGQHIGRQTELHQRLLIVATCQHVSLGLGQEVAQIAEEFIKNGEAGAGQ